MELVYLWVEKYKNIENQGFDFSPRFQCIYDGKNFTINVKKDYVSIFPDKINVTAIVGQNGSGKSNILSSLISFIDNEKSTLIMIYVDENDDYKVFQKNLHINTILINEKKISCQEYNCSNINNLLYYLYIDFSLADLEYKNDKDNYKNDFSLEPTREYYSKGVSSKIEPASFDANMNKNMLYFYHYIYQNSFEKLLIDLNLPCFNILKFESLSRIRTKITKINAINNLLDDNMLFDANFGRITNLIENVDNDIMREQIQNIHSKVRDKNISLNGISDDEIKYIEDFFILLTPTIVDDKGMTFDNLSSGQKLLLSYLGIILKNIYKIKNRLQTMNIVIDEFESALHPQWQKKFLSTLLKIISLSQDNLKINIYLTTHSPFLISDLPKENIIFLDKLDENTKNKYRRINIDGLIDGNCINVSKYIDMKPFGSNIHTLLSNGFFMNDGLMGEFAKSRITEILNYLNGDEPLKTIEQNQVKTVIESIGEDFLRNKLLTLYYKRFTNESKLRKKKLLETRIKDMQNELDELN